MNKINRLPNSETAGAFMHLVGKTVSSIEEVKNICAQYLAISQGAFLKDPHPYATGQHDYELGGPSARLSDIARTLVNARNKENPGKFNIETTNSQMIAAALSTGDLQHVISNAVNLIVMPSYSDLIQDLEWTKKIQISDFREGQFANIDVNDLLEIEEGAEVKFGSIFDDGEKIRLRTFGRNVFIHRHLLINNDFDFITDAIKAWVVSSSRKDAALQYGVLNDNPVMSDGKPLFHSDHKNLMPANARPFTDAIGEAMSMLRSQETKSGEKTNAKAAYILVPTSLEAGAYEAASKIMSLGKNKLQIISSAYMSQDSWYVMASPDQYPVVGRVLLEGSKDPLIVEPVSGRSIPSSFDGTGLRVRLDVNAHALSHLGAVKVPIQ